MRPIVIGAIIALSAPCLALAGEEPVRTVAKLDAKDPKYDTQACRAARAEAIDYQEPGGLVKKAVSMGGNAVLPLAGTVASTALGMRANSKGDKLSKTVAIACVSDPLNEETPLIGAPKAEKAPGTVVVSPAAPMFVAAEPAVREIAAPKAATSETVATSQ
jgi:hypothetical protein